MVGTCSVWEVGTFIHRPRGTYNDCKKINGGLITGIVRKIKHNINTS